jgi:flavin reductase (DIM6/NTAB) family NADH-FMN oxidoreductase RutF
VIFYEPHLRDRAVLPHDPFKALVAPRPIGWVSTMGTDGSVNLAPYSFFNAVSDTPPMIAFSSAGRKDSMTFAGELDEFVWNLPTWELREAMNESSAPLPRGENEFERAGLTMAPSRLVRPPRVAESPCAFECKVVHQLELRATDGSSSEHFLTVGQIVGVHLAESAVTDGRVDTALLRPVARCGYQGEYTVVESLFDMRRPTS